MIGVPVLILTAVDVLYQTYTIGPAEQVGRTLGAADARIDWIGSGAVQVDPNGAGYTFSGAAGSDSAPPPTTAELLAHLPTGSRAIEYRDSGPSVAFYTRAGLSDATLVGLDYRDPMADGIVRQDAGRAPGCRTRSRSRAP